MTTPTQHKNSLLQENVAEGCEDCGELCVGAFLCPEEVKNLLTPSGGEEQAMDDPLWLGTLLQERIKFF